MECAKIQVTVDVVYPGYQTFDYKWIGDARAPIALMPGDKKEIPYPLKFIESGCMGDIYIRTDVSFWRLTEFYLRAHNIFTWLNSRLIITAHIWGLVKLNPGCRYSWRDAFARKWKK